MLCVVMYVLSLAVNSSEIGIAGRAFVLFVLMDVIVFCSMWMFLALNPLLPCISIGLSPVCMLMSILSDSVPCAPAVNAVHCLSVGGCMLGSSP